MSKKKITLAHVMSGQRICGACTPEQFAPVTQAAPRRCRAGLVTLALGASLLAARADAQTTPPAAGQQQAPGDTAASPQVPASATSANASPAAQPMLVVRGSIRSRETGAPVWQAVVAVEGTERRAITDSVGDYVLRVPAGGARPLRLRFGALGYRPVSRSVARVSGEVRVNATLELQVICPTVVVEPDPRRRVGYHVTRIEGSRP